MAKTGRCGLARPDRKSLDCQKHCNNLKFLLLIKRNWCYIKKINKTKIEITRALLLEVKKVKQKTDNNFNITLNQSFLNMHLNHI